MKPGTDTPVASQVVKTTTIRTVPADDDLKTPDLWEYLAALERKPQTEQEKHLIYLYRLEPAPSIPLQKCSQAYFTMPDGTRVPIGNQEEVDFAISRYYGGGLYRIIVKSGSQWITQGRFQIGGSAKSIAPVDLSGGAGNGTGSNPSIAPMGEASSTAFVADRAMSALSMQERQSAEIGFRAMSTAAEVMQRFALPKEGSGGDDITRQFMQVMIARAMQDPFDQMVKFFALMREMGGMMGGAAPAAAGGMPADMMQQIFKAMCDRFLNPTPSGAPVSASAELMRQLPQIGSQVSESLQAFARAREAEARIAAMQRGGASVPLQPNPQVIPPAVTQPANGAPTMEFIEAKILEMLRAPVSAEQAADDVLAFLEPLDPSAVEQLAKLGEGGLLALFQSRPILKQACNNMPRLIEFIRAFLRMHAEDMAAAATGETQLPAKPPLPN